MKFVEITLNRRCTSVHFSKQPIRTPACHRQPGTWAVGRLVSRSVVSNFQSILVRRFIHLGDVHSKQWAAYLIRSFGRVIELLCMLFFVRIWQPAACGILFLNNHKNRNRSWTTVFL